jgi:hypothetical protein
VCSGALFPRIKRQGREAGHSPPSSAVVNNGGVIPPLRHISARYNASLIKHRNNLVTVIRRVYDYLINFIIATETLHKS